jgi:hypothetical protein
VAQNGKEILNGEAFEVIDWLEKPVDMSRLIKASDSLQVNSNKPSLCKGFYVKMKRRLISCSPKLTLCYDPTIANNQFICALRLSAIESLSG